MQNAKCRMQNECVAFGDYLNHFPEENTTILHASLCTQHFAHQRDKSVFVLLSYKANAAGITCGVCNKKRGEENEKEKNQIISLSTYIITSICEKNKWINFKIV